MLCISGPRMGWSTSHCMLHLRYINAIFRFSGLPPQCLSCWWTHHPLSFLEIVHSWLCIHTYGRSSKQRGLLDFIAVTSVSFFMFSLPTFFHFHFSELVLPLGILVCLFFFFVPKPCRSSPWDDSPSKFLLEPIFKTFLPWFHGQVLCHQIFNFHLLTMLLFVFLTEIWVTSYVSQLSIQVLQARKIQPPKRT